jgi:hypothetical protein
MLAPGLPEEVRKAVASAFEAMSVWRCEMAATSERHGEKVFDRMGDAAKALGWPAQIVDATQSHMQSIAKMQLQMMDQLMDAWEEQLKSPNPMGSFPSAMMSKLQSFPGFPGGASFPGMEGMSGATNPLQFWMQVGEQWQKNWAQAMKFWADAGTQGGPGKR